MEKIILYGRSLGGYLAPRAASRDPRIDGLILDNHLYDRAEPVQGDKRASTLAVSPFSSPIKSCAL
jgi:pimeloyl-ACP methyl ester carboxylesterase